MNKKLALLSSFLWLAIISSAQNFAPAQVNAFGLERTGFNTSPAFADIDADGDLDLFAGVSSGDFAYFRNKGNEGAMILTDRHYNPFDLSALSGTSAPTLADFDGDNDYDILSGSDNGLHYLENTGDSLNPQFGTVVNMPFSINPPNGINYPYLVDMDADGDQDLWISAADGNVYYFENTSSNDTIRFQAPVKGAFGLDDESTRVSAAFGDADRDGDPDAVVGLSNNGDMVYYENTGTAQEPSFTRIGINVFGLSNVVSDPKPVFADHDADGDVDLLVGNADGDFYYFENNMPSVIACGPTTATFNLYPNPANDIVNVNTYDSYPKTIEIRSTTGQLLISISTSHEEENIDVSELSTGLYLVFVRKDSGINTVSRKLVISRQSNHQRSSTNSGILK